MDNRQLQIFHSVVKEGSFTRAANALHMAQPAVSIAIRKLEQELGQKLLSRAGKTILPTAEGERLLVHAQKILQQFELAAQEFVDLNNLHAGQVRLGTSAMLGSYYFPEKLTEFRRSHPGINIRITGEGTQRAQQLILTGEIDMGIVNMEGVPPNLQAHSLAVKEEVVACVGPKHRFAGKRSLSFESFAEEPLILYTEGYYLRELIASLSEHSDLQPRIACETNILRLMINQVREGLGLGFCLRRVVEQEKDLVGVPFETPVFLDLGIAWKRNQYLSKANRQFVSFLLGKELGEV